MKKNLFTIAAGVAFVSAVSCSVEEKNLAPETDLRVPMEFTAGIGTKTQLNPDHSVVWSEDDVISIFDGEYNNDFTINGEGGAASATFTGKALPDAAAYYALYPHSADAKLIDNVISSTLPSEQTVTAEATFATMVNPSVAVAAENSLTFKNIASILQVNVWNLAEGQKVTGISAKADKSLAGAYTVDPSASEPAAVASGSENTGVSLAGEITDLNEDGLYSYSMVVFPGTYNDLTVTVTYSDGSKSTFTASSAVDMPVSGGRTISIDASQAEAPAEKNLYEKFMDGEDIVIAGKTYNISQYEDPDNDVKRVTNTNNTIWDESTLVGNGKIIFVDIAEQTEPLKLGPAGDIILVGVDPNNKPLVVRTGNALKSSNTGSSRLVLKNLNIDLQNEASTAVSPAFNAATNFGELTFDNCDITLAKANDFIRSNTSGTSISEINIIDCNIKVPVRTALNILSAGDIPQTIETFNFSNNILHCDDGITYTFRMINSTNSSKNVMEVSNIIVNNNTFVNVAHNNSAMVLTKSIGYAEAKNNLIYYSFNISDYSDITQSAFPFFRAFTSYPTTAICNSNIAYQQETDGKDIGFRIWQSATNAPSVEQNIPKAETDPFEGGDLSTFTPAPAYAEYGAQR